MKKVLLLLLLVALIGGGVWAYLRFVHVAAPQNAYLSTAAAAMLGDETLFLEGFTSSSRPLVAGLLALARGDDPKTSRRHPYYYLTSEEVEDVTVAPDGDHATIRLRRPGDRSLASVYDVPMKLEERAWKIDAFAFTGGKAAVDRAR